jgi:hypothetical protein
MTLLTLVLEFVPNVLSSTEIAQHLIHGDQMITRPRSNSKYRITKTLSLSTPS